MTDEITLSQCECICECSQAAVDHCWPLCAECFAESLVGETLLHGEKESAQ